MIIEKVVDISNLELINSKMIIYSQLPNQFEDLEQDFMEEDQLKIGKDSNYFIINLGLLFIVLQILIFNTILFYLSRKLTTNFKICGKIHDKVKNDLFWNGYERFLIQICLDVSISTVIQVQYYKKRVQSFDSEFYSVFGIFNNITMGILVIFVFVFPIFCLFFYLPRFDKW